MTKTNDPELWVPADRLLPILEQYRGRTEHLTGRTARKLNLLRAGEQQFVSLSVVDEILIEMDLFEWLRLPADQGGLADIYFEGKQYGRPATSKPKYKTDAERLAARRASWRAKDHKRRIPQVTVECPSCGESRQVGKYYARNRMRPGAVCSRCSGAQVGQLWVEERARRAA